MEPAGEEPEGSGEPAREDRGDAARDERVDALAAPVPVPVPVERAAWMGEETEDGAAEEKAEASEECPAPVRVEGEGDEECSDMSEAAAAAAVVGVERSCRLAPSSCGPPAPSASTLTRSCERGREADAADQPSATAPSSSDMGDVARSRGERGVDSALLCVLAGRRARAADAQCRDGVEQRVEGARRRGAPGPMPEAGE